MVRWCPQRCVQCSTQAPRSRRPTRPPARARLRLVQHAGVLGRARAVPQLIGVRLPGVGGSGRSGGAHAVSATAAAREQRCRQAPACTTLAESRACGPSRRRAQTAAGRPRTSGSASAPSPQPPAAAAGTAGRGGGGGGRQRRRRLWPASSVQGCCCSPPQHWSVSPAVPRPHAARRADEQAAARAGVAAWRRSEGAARAASIVVGGGVVMGRPLRFGV